MSFDKIYYKGKEMKHDGFAAKNFRAIPVAIEHNGDGSITVCKEIVDAIYADLEVPEHVRNYFKPSEGFKFKDEGFEKLGDV